MHIPNIRRMECYKMWNDYCRDVCKKGFNCDIADVCPIEDFAKWISKKIFKVEE